MMNDAIEYLATERLVEKAFAFSARDFRYRAVEMLVTDGLGLDGSRILDIGCGPASSVGAILALGGQPVCVDLSVDMLNHTRRVYPDIAIVRADARCRLPFDDATFDGVVCSGLLHSVTKRSLIEEITRVTAPGGRVMIANKGIAPWTEGTAWYDSAVAAMTRPSADPPPLWLLPADCREMSLIWSDPPIFYALAFTVGEPNAA